jgi:transposase-like protein
MSFQPAFCPCESPECEGRSGFQYQRRGTFRRACDGRIVQRFQCMRCMKTFSTQTFRVDYKLRKPAKDLPIFRQLVSKVTMRQISKTEEICRRTIARRLELWGKHCKAFHLAAMNTYREQAATEGCFLLDELETFETHRKLKPVTVPVLVHKPSHAILHVAVGALAPRKPLKPREAKKLAQYEKEDGGPRRSESRAKVWECFEALKKLTEGRPQVIVRTDQKSSYAVALKKLFGKRLVHGLTHSKAPRTYRNPLFVVNHTLAMLRDNVSRLVRRNWGHAKKRERLEWHLWIYVAWRNYVRQITNEDSRHSAGQVAGLCPRMLDLSELLGVKILHPQAAQ